MPRLTRLPSASFAFVALLAVLVTVSGCNSETDTASTDTTEEKPAVAADEKVPAPPTETESEPATETAAMPAEDGEEAAAPAEEAPDFDDAEEAVAEAVPPGADPLVPQGATRPTTEGWWRIIFSVNGNDFAAGFVKIGKTDDGGFQVEEVRTNGIVNPAEVVRHEVTDKTVRLFFEHEDNKFDFAGTLDGNVIRGNLQFASPRQNLVRLVPVKEEDVTDAALNEMQLGTTFGAQPIVQALQTEQPVESLREVAKEWRLSPVLYMAYDALLQNAAGLEIDRATLEELIAGFKEVASLWGERAEQAASLNIAAGLLEAGYETEIAERELEEARNEAPELAANWEDLIESARKRGQVAKASRERLAAIEAAVAQIEAGQTEQGLQALRQIHSQKPSDLVATYRLAVAERDHGSKEEALRLFGQLAALPQIEAGLGATASETDFVEPRPAAEKLYEEVKGSLDGIEEFLTAAYSESVTSFLTDEDRNRQPTGSNRTVLVELLTGATCPPCVAADVATEAVEHSFPGDDVVVLRYHVHVPGPDPLTNPDTLARMDYYQAGGTPTLLINGTTVPAGGYYPNSEEVYQRIAAPIAEAATKPARANVELSAAVEGDVLRINAKASGVENPSDSHRLRIAVAENAIDYTARNGIRQHEMIVREMPGGAAGIAAVDGTFSFEQEIPLVELRDRLATYLDEFETQAAERYGQPFAFDEKPLSLRRITVVAFLQDDATREILQAAVVPIEQEIELPPPAATEIEDDSEPAAGPALAPPQE